MSVALRFARGGSKKRPFFRLVATDKRSPRDGRFIEQLGTYDPRTKAFNVDHARYAHWMSHGALPSGTVSDLIRKNKPAAPVA